MKKFPLYAQTLTALFIGTALGYWLGPQAGFLAGFSKAVIWLVKTAAIPLLFLAIFDAVIKAEFKGQSLFWLMAVATLNATCAVTIALVLSNVFQPGNAMPLVLPAESSHSQFDDMMKSFTWQKAATMFFESPMIAAILLALAFGVILLIIESRGPRVWITKSRELADRGLALWIRVMGYILYLVPWAVLGSVAKVVGEHGSSVVHGLAIYLFFCLLGMAIHIILVYHTWILFIARIPVRKFWREAREPVAHSFGINSSLATLPSTLRALDKLGVSPGSARLSACVGTNFNNDGILLYEVVAALFIAQAYGYHFPIWQQLVAAGICVIATVGVGGIPEAGIISLAIVLSALKLPLEGITILLTVDWIIARCRSATNVLGDMTVAIALDVVGKQSNVKPAAGP